MIFVRKDKMQKQQVNKCKVLRQGCLKWWRSGSLFTSCAAGRVLSCVPPWCQSGEKNINCPLRSPIICSHAYRKKNKVYTLLFLFGLTFIHIRINNSARSSHRLVYIYSCEHDFLLQSYFITLLDLDWHLRNKAARSWLMVSGSGEAAPSLFIKGVVCT